MLVKIMWGLVIMAALLAIIISIYLTGLNLPIKQMLLGYLTHFLP
ncbi:hypothetical protein [Secundilactobacillus collinoides]|mgnify:CR=1 FL=1|nr:hypothetical protein [Secundilactobacillus collinoides]